MAVVAALIFVCFLGLFQQQEIDQNADCAKAQNDIGKTPNGIAVVRRFPIGHRLRRGGRAVKQIDVRFRYKARFYLAVFRGVSSYICDGILSYFVA